jgi:hypothetical protein
MRVANLSRVRSATSKQGLRHRTPDWEERMARWEESVATNQPTWTVFGPVVEDITTGGQKYLPQPDGSFLAQGYAVGKSGPHFWLTNDLQGITAFRFEQLTDPNLPVQWTGSFAPRNCRLLRIHRGHVIVGFHQQNPPQVQPTPRPISAWPSPAHAGAFRQGDFPIASSGPVTYAIDNDETTAWGIDAGQAVATPIASPFSMREPAGLPGGTVWDFRVIQRHGGPINDAT